MISGLTNSLSSFQNIVNKTNLSAFIATSNALNTSRLANFTNLTLPFVNLSSLIQINQSAIVAMSDVVFRTIACGQVNSYNQFGMLLNLLKSLLIAIKLIILRYLNELLKSFPFLIRRRKLNRLHYV